MGIPYVVIDKLYLGLFTIQTWGLMVALGFLAGLLLARRRARRIGMRPENALDLGLLIIVSAIVGARLFFVLNEWGQFAGRPLDMLKVWDGGFAWYGGLVSAFFAALWYMQRLHLSFAAVADAFIPGVALGEAIGRIGCFLIHDHLGRITTFPLGINVGGVLRHETGAYAGINAFLLFLALVLIERLWRKKYQGALTHLFLVWYGIATFAIYGLRATDLIGSDPRLGAFTPSQYFAAALALVGIALIVRHAFQSKTLSPTINRRTVTP